jgi:opacity protein-like surface antigen
MKTNSLLLLASLAVLASSASAASVNQTDSDVIVLPTYSVSAPRYLPVEQQINASLNELRQQAQAPAVIASELPMLKGQFARQGTPAKDAKNVRVAKS